MAKLPCKKFHPNRVATSNFDLNVPNRTLAIMDKPHWGIENSLHWSLGVTFKEDRWRIRKDHGPRNVATLCNISTTCYNGDPA